MMTTREQQQAAHARALRIQEARRAALRYNDASEMLGRWFILRCPCETCHESRVKLAGEMLTSLKTMYQEVMQ